MLEFTFTTIGRHGRMPAQVRCGDAIITIPDGHGTVTFRVFDNQVLAIDFFSKTESDTIVEDGNIVADTEFRFEKVWCDGILLESWFIRDCVYFPRYFAGYLEQVPDAPKTVVSPHQFNFPGDILWKWNNNFWDWYFEQRNARMVINFLDKDPDRVWKFNGSLDPCDDLVQKIREVIK